MRPFLLILASGLILTAAAATAATTGNVMFPPDNCDPNHSNILTWKTGHNVTCLPLPPTCDAKSYLTWNGTTMSCKKPKLACTQAYRHNNDGLVIESGEAAAVTQVGTADLSGNYWGLACTTGYEKTGCHQTTDGGVAAGQPWWDADLWPSANSCLADDEEFGIGTYVNITCCKLDSE